MMKAFFNHRYFLWTILTLPLTMMVAGFANGQSSAHNLLHPSGEFSARFMIIAMMLGPLVVLFPKAGAWRWMLARRRYFGVAAFGYALAHTVFYLIDKGVISAALAEATKLSIWTGWLAFFIFVPLAITSNNGSMRALGKRWKTLQRWVYVAALATAAHWLFLDYHIGPVLAHFVPLAALEFGRFMKLRNRTSKANASGITSTGAITP